MRARLITEEHRFSLRCLPAKFCFKESTHRKETENLKVIETGLVPVWGDDDGQNLVNARELHEFLEVGRDFSTWIQERIAKYEFQEGMDFSSNRGKSTGGRPTVEYWLTLHMAKELCMVENNERGREARRYFITMEQKAKVLGPTYQVPQTFAQALRLAADLQEQLEAQKPLVAFAETCLTSSDSILIRELAKVATKHGLVTGEKRLYRTLREWGLVLKDSTEPTQRAMDAGWFEVLQRPVPTPYGEILRRTTKVTPRGQVYIIERLRAEQMNG